MVFELRQGGGGRVMDFDLTEVTGIGKWSEERRKTEQGEEILYLAENGKAFFVVRAKTLEVRCDGKLGRKLREEYETVMESRYFGRGGIEIVPSGQLARGEIEDLVRLSYNLTLEDAHEG